MQTPTERSQQLLAQTPDLETVIDREWERLDHERELPDSIAEQLYKADLLRIWTPRELGGLELDPLSGLETLASISSLEGSVGWNAMILGAYSFFAGRLPTSVAKEIWGDPRGAVAGALPRGRAAEHVGIQADLGRARMDALSAERVLFSAVEDVWSTVQAGELPSLEQRAAIRVGCINAGTSGARAVDTCYSIAGSASIFESNHLERSFRDVHAAAQHVAVSPKSLDVVGRVTLGLEPGRLI